MLALVLPALLAIQFQPSTTRAPRPEDSLLGPREVISPGFFQIDHPGADPQLVLTLRKVCNDTPAPYATLRQRERRLDTRVTGGGARASDWDALACARAQLFDQATMGAQGIEMAAGASWARGAMGAALRALGLRPDQPQSAELLALLSMSDAEPSPLRRIAETLNEAVDAGARGPALLRACGDFNYRIEDYGRSERCARLGLQGGSDSTWHLIRLARLSFRVDQVGEGATYFQRAAAAARSHVARLEMDWHFQWFLWPDERQQWVSMADSLRGAWVRERLAARDVRDGQPLGTRVAEHFKRLEYVEKNFRLRVPRILKETMLRGAYRRWQIEFDDRGVAWMRLGQPQKRVGCPPFPGAPLFEIFVYQIDGQQVLLTFRPEDHDGSGGATRFAPGFIADCFCNIDPFRCNLASLGRPSREAMAEVRRQDRAFLAIATTQDDNGVRAPKTLKLVAGMHRLWDLATGAPIALITYGVPIKDLDRAVDSTTGTTNTTLSLAFRQLEGGTAAEHDTLVSRRLTFPASTTPKDASIIGFFTMPIVPAVTTWSLVGTQSGRVGRAYGDNLRPLEAAPFTISDVVLGIDSDRLAWSNGRSVVPLAGLNAVNRTEPVHIYYQVKSDSDRVNLRANVALYRNDGVTPPEAAALQVGYRVDFDKGLSEERRILDVSRLEPGAYRLELKISRTDGTVLVMRSTALNVRK